MNKDIDRIESWNPCVVGLRWAEKQSSLKKVWDKCEDAEWLFFICQAEKALNLKKEQSVAIAIAIANRVLDKFEAVCPDDKRPSKAIEAAQAWLDNPTKENADAARAAARAAKAASDAAYEAARDVAASAGYAADAAYAAYAAAHAAAYAAVDAACDAAHASARAAAHASARAATHALDAYDAERKAQADIIRLLVPNPFK